MFMNDDKLPMVEVLVRLGLSAHEAKTYLALLESEGSSIRSLAERTGINRGTTYEALKRLVDQGLVSVQDSGKRERYAAESPERIYRIIRDKRKDLLLAQRASERMIPALLAQRARPKGRPLVRYYEDDSGVVAILRDVLQTCVRLDTPEYLVYSSRPLRRYLYRKFPQFTEQRTREGIWVRVIAIGEGGDPAALSDRKWLPGADDEGSSSYTIVYGSKVAIISIASDETPYGVVIEDEGNASMQRLLFEQLWASLD